MLKKVIKIWSKKMKMYHGCPTLHDKELPVVHWCAILWETC